MPVVFSREGLSWAPRIVHNVHCLFCHFVPAAASQAETKRGFSGLAFLGCPQFIALQEMRTRCQAESLAKETAARQCLEKKISIEEQNR